MTRKTWIVLLIMLVMSMAGGLDLRTWAADAAPDAAAQAKIAADKKAADEKAAADKKAEEEKAFQADNNQPWPPALPGANADGTITITSPDFLVVPDEVKKEMAKPGAAPFTVAKTPPTIDLATHHPLPHRALRGLWSAWGDICVASDGKVYVGNGDEGDEVGGTGSAFVYQYDPETKVLKRIIDCNRVRPRKPGDISFVKVHAGIQETREGKIIAICTLADGGTAGQVKWSKNVPGSQFIEYDPKTGKSRIIGALQARCTATTKMDTEHDLFYLCLEGLDGPKRTTPDTVALGVFDVKKHKVTRLSDEGAIIADRNIAMDLQGNIYFNGKDGFWKYDAQSHKVGPTGVAFPDDTGEDGKPAHPTMRSSATPTHDDVIYGTTMGPGRLFAYDAAHNKIEMLGPEFLLGNYTTVTVLSPDQKYLYYLPGAHGGAKDIGTPVVQYDLATHTRKVLAFLRAPIEKQEQLIVAGTYGVKMSSDGSTLYVNFNGSPAEAVRPKRMPANYGFGYTSFAAIHIPESER